MFAMKGLWWITMWLFFFFLFCGVKIFQRCLFVMISWRKEHYTHTRTRIYYIHYYNTLHMNNENVLFQHMRFGKQIKKTIYEKQQTHLYWILMLVCIFNRVHMSNLLSNIIIDPRGPFINALSTTKTTISTRHGLSGIDQTIKPRLS